MPLKLWTLSTTSGYKKLTCPALSNEHTRVEAREFYFLHDVQMGSEAHPASYSMGTLVLSHR